MVALSSGSAIRDWRPLGDFKTESTCISGIKRLNIDVNLYRCIAN